MAAAAVMPDISSDHPRKSTRKKTTSVSSVECGSDPSESVPSIPRVTSVHPTPIQLPLSALSNGANGHAAPGAASAALPKITPRQPATAAVPPVASSSSSLPDPSPPHSLLPKLKSKWVAEPPVAESTSNGTARRKHSTGNGDGDEQQSGATPVVTSSLPSVSARPSMMGSDSSAGSGGGNKFGQVSQLSDENVVSVRKSKKEKSSKKRAKDHRDHSAALAEKENHPAGESASSLTNRTAASKPVASLPPPLTNPNDDDDGEYDYESYDEACCDSGAPSATHSRTNSSHGINAPSLPADEPANAAPAQSTQAAQTTAATNAVNSTSSASVSVKKKVGPRVRVASRPQVDFELAEGSAEIKEELDGSVQLPPSTIVKGTPHPKTGVSRLFHHHSQEDIEEEMSPSNATGSSSSAAGAQTPLTRRLLVEFKTPSDSSAAHRADGRKAVQVQSPAVGAKKVTTPVAKAVPAPAAAASKKKQSAVNSNQSSTSRQNVSSPLQSIPSPSHSDSTAKSSVAAAAPTRRKMSGGPTRRGADASAAAATIATAVDSAAVPEELIRFTILPDMIHSLYAQSRPPAGPSNPTNRNTTIEFSRTKATITNAVVNETPLEEDQLPSSTRWIPVFTTSVSSSASPTSPTSPSASSRSPIDRHVFTVDSRTLLGEMDDRDEGLLVQLWENTYSEELQPSPVDSAAVVPVDPHQYPTQPNQQQPQRSMAPLNTSPNSSFNRTLLAEFRTSMRDFAAQSERGGIVSTTTSTAVNSKNPRTRSALKAASREKQQHENGANRPHVRFFDKVEIFRLSRSLEERSVVSEEKENVNTAAHTNSPSLTTNGVHTQQLSHEQLQSLVVSEATFRKRVPLKPALKKQPSLVKGPNSPTAGSSSKVFSFSSPSSSAAMKIRARCFNLPPPVSYPGRMWNPQLELLMFHSGGWTSLFSTESAMGTNEPSWQPFVLNQPGGITGTEKSPHPLLDAPLLLRVTHREDPHSPAVGSGAGPVAPAESIGHAFTSLRQLWPSASHADHLPVQSFVLINGGSHTSPLVSSAAAASTVPRAFHAGRLVLTFDSVHPSSAVTPVHSSVTSRVVHNRRTSGGVVSSSTVSSSSRSSKVSPAALASINNASIINSKLTQ